MNKRKQDENKMKKEDSRGMVRITIWSGKCSGRIKPNGVELSQMAGELISKNKELFIV